MSLRRSYLPMLLLFAAALPASAHGPHTFGIFDSESAIPRSATIPAFQFHSLYIVAVNSDHMSGWEASVRWSNTSWSVLSMILNPPNALNVSSAGNFVVGLGGCYFEGPTHLLVTYQVGWFASSEAATDTWVCLDRAYPSSFGDVPGYANCTSELIPFQLAAPSGELDAGCLVINPVETVPASPQSWSSIKARYGSAVVP